MLLLFSAGIPTVILGLFQPGLFQPYVFQVSVPPGFIGLRPRGTVG